MPQGHHGANHPVKDFTTGKVEIVSMNHGFAVDRASLPANAEDDACVAVRRLELRHCAFRPPGLFGAAPPRGLAGPRDSHYLFRRFVDLIAAAQALS
jgi:carbamoyl-phosphate synthase small subunit